MDDQRRSVNSIPALHYFDNDPLASTIPETSLCEGKFPLPPPKTSSIPFDYVDSSAPSSRPPVTVTSVPTYSNPTRYYEDNVPSNYSGRIQAIQGFSDDFAFQRRFVDGSFPSTIPRQASPKAHVRLPGRIKKPSSGPSTTSSASASATTLNPVKRVAFEQEFDIPGKSYNFSSGSDKENFNPPPISTTPSLFPSTSNDDVAWLRQVVAEQNKQVLALQEQVIKLLSGRESESRGCGCSNQCRRGESSTAVTLYGKQNKETQTSFDEGPASKTMLLGDHRSVGCGPEGRNDEASAGKEVAVTAFGGHEDDHFYQNIMARVNEMVMQKSGVVHSQKADDHNAHKHGRNRAAEKKSKKKKKRRSRGSPVRKEDSVLEATVRKLHEYGAASFIDVEKLKKGAVAAAVAGTGNNYGHNHNGFLPPPGGFPPMPAFGGHEHHGHERKHKKSSKQKSKSRGNPHEAQPLHPGPGFPWQGDVDAATGRMKFMSILVNDDGKTNGPKERSVEISAVDMQYAHRRRAPMMPDFRGFGYGMPPPYGPGYPYMPNYGPPRPHFPETREDSSEDSSSSTNESDTSSSESEDEGKPGDIERRYNALRKKDDDGERILNVEELRALPKIL